MRPISVIIADDHPIFREGVKNILVKSGEFSVIHEAQNGEELLDLMRDQKCELVILDLRMSDRDDGLNALKTIKSEHTDTKVLIMSQVCQRAILDEVLQAGADGYVTKNDVPDMLIPFLQSILKDTRAFSPRIQELLSSGPKEGGEILTKKETEVLKLLVAGKSCDESAEFLDISVSTINFHRRNIKDKLNARNQAEVIRIATENDLF